METPSHVDLGSVENNGTSEMGENLDSNLDNSDDNGSEIEDPTLNHSDNIGEDPDDSETDIKDTNPKNDISDLRDSDTEVRNSDIDHEDSDTEIEDSDNEQRNSDTELVNYESKNSSAGLGYENDEFADNEDENNEYDNDEYADAEFAYSDSELRESELRYVETKSDSDQSEYEGLELPDENSKTGSILKVNISGSRHVCVVCSVQFKWPGQLADHMNVHTGDTPFNCDHCSKVFHTRKQQTDHLRTHKDLEFPCPDCELKFRHAPLLEKHLRTHTGEKSFSCTFPECSESFTTSRSLRYHVVNIHEPPGDFQCDKCERSFVSLELLKFHTYMRHVRNRTVNLSQKCPHCTYASNMWKQVEQHIKCVHESGVEPIFCECGQAVASVSGLSAHARKHENVRVYECEFCPKKFLVQNSLKEHTSIHKKERSHPCDECDQKFFTKAYLRKHLVNVHHVPKKHERELQFKCPVETCQRSFSSPGHLNSHAVVHSRPEKRVFCDTCGKGFKARGDLRSHIRIHSGEKPFMCKECGDAFKQRGHLALHLRTHTGERPYKCEHCEKAFTTNSALTKHNYTHDGIKPYKCPECAESYTVRARLGEHMKVHIIVDVAYVCSSCSAKFSSQNRLDRHQSKHHAKELFTCPVCDTVLPSKSALKAHKRTHSGRKHKMDQDDIENPVVVKFTCVVCHDSFPEETSLQSHIVSDHKDLTTFFCHLCYQVFETNDEFRQHSQSCLVVKTENDSDEQPKSFVASKRVKLEKDDEVKIISKPIKSTLM